MMDSTFIVLKVVFGSFLSFSSFLLIIDKTLVLLVVLPIIGYWF